ncbi:MAG: pantoate--beta-alanine ligase [Gammaproteobacteria bacterium]|nr:pantoate--beta-alanine ligase [Gammaproteobacteria bacterium]
MQIIEHVKQLQLQTDTWRQQGLRIGFVPTMGNLHDGHLALVKRAVEVSDRVVVSIFVNPLQFDQAGDLAAYPRTLEQDLAKLKSVKVDVVFTPDEQQLYPLGRESITRVEVPRLSGLLEGAARPGHFSGVTTVVAKLFHCVQPHVAIFGEKDFQQLLLVRRMVADLNMPIEILAQPTEREADGLAMSSRNSRLTEAQRQQAAYIYSMLNVVRQQLDQADMSFVAVERMAEKMLVKQGFNPDYVAIREVDTLAEPEVQTGVGRRELVILVAARLGDVRLIDNLRVDLM